MPPKKPPGPSKKNEAKKVERVIEDKTFGLKNKKGTKQQKFVKHVENQVKNKGQSTAKLEEQKFAQLKAKKNKDELDIDSLIKPMAAMPKIDKNVDPKSMLCMFFKQGLCQKGDKCKFSHDLAIEFRAAKRNLYVDERSDGMDTWDEAMLNEVIAKKHGEKDLLKPKTAIVCKFFLEAVEDSKYGWFWECPNGDSCIYKHCLPPGYVLKKEKKKLDEAAQVDRVSLEELIEKERAALGGNLTKITYESFVSWKKRKLDEKVKLRDSEMKKKRDQFKSGKEGGLSGRDLFTFNPDLVGQDDDEADDDVYEQEVQEDEEEEECVVKELADNAFQFQEDANGVQNGLPQSSGDVAGATGGKPDEVLAINEDLFDIDDIPDDEDDEDGEDSDTVVENGLDSGPSGSNPTGTMNGYENGDDTAYRLNGAQGSGDPS